MWNQFLLQNFRFAVYAFGMLVMMSTAWLYLDSTTGNRRMVDYFKILGFGLLAVAMGAETVKVEGVTWGLLSITPQLIELVVFGIKMLGGMMVLWGLFSEPLIPKPKLAIFVLLGANLPLGLSVGIVYSLVAWSYLRRASVGLERHLYKPALGMGIFALAEGMMAQELFRRNSNVWISNLVSPFGVLWVVQLLVVLLGSVVISVWVFGYLLKRFETQLVLLISMLVLSIYLVTTLCFSGLVIMKLKERFLEQLSNQAKLLGTMIVSRQSELLSDAKWLSNDKTIIANLGNVDKSDLYAVLKNYLENKKASGISILDEKGTVLMRGEDRQKIGDNLSTSDYVQEMLGGKSGTTMSLVEGGLTDVVRIISESPIIVNGKVVGGVLIYENLDNAYVDNLKVNLGNEVLIYSANLLSATTLVGGGDSLPVVNSRLSDNKITSKLLDAGNSFDGGITISGKEYLVGMVPLKNSQLKVVGAVGVVESSSTLLKEMGGVTLATFGGALLLLLLSELPAYLIARNIAKQIS